jgi:hypothetical protein
MEKVRNVLDNSWTEVTSDFKEKCSAGASDKFTSQEVADTITYLSAKRRIEESVKFVPESPCEKQVVLGLSENIASYFMYNQENEADKFLILADKNWSDEGNNLYVRCAIYGELSKTCQYPVRILLPKDKNELFGSTKEGVIFARVTIFELITLQEIFNGETNIPENYQLKNNLYTTVKDYSDIPYNIIFIKNPYYGKSNEQLRRDRIPTGVKLPFRQPIPWNSTNSTERSIISGEFYGKSRQGETRSNYEERKRQDVIDNRLKEQQKAIDRDRALPTFDTRITPSTSRDQEELRRNYEERKRQEVIDNRLKEQQKAIDRANALSTFNTRIGGAFSRKARRRNSRGKKTQVNRRGKRTHTNNMKKRKHKTRRH